MSLARALAGAFVAALATPAPGSAPSPHATGACGYPPPAVPPALVAPLDGAADVPVQPKSIALQVYVPRGITDAAPNLDDERVVLVDALSNVTEGGILRLVDPQMLPDGVTPLRALDPGLSGAMRYVATWLPPLRPAMRYAVRIVLPYRGNCVYANVGSFATSGAVSGPASDRT